MEVKYSDLKKKQVISVTDGKHLGHVCDLTIDTEGYKVKNFIVTGGKGLVCVVKEEVVVPISAVKKMGEDAVLVDLTPPKPTPCPPCPPPCPDRRDFCEYD